MPSFGVPGVPQSLPAVRALVTSPGGYPYSITGVTRDRGGAVLGGVAVKLFRTSDDSLVNQTTSDANGRYSLPASNLMTHYVVVYLPGSPDVSGSSANTLVGA